MKKIKYTEEKISVIGLGYVGLPLAIEFSKKQEVVAFDIDKNRINQLKKGVDKTQEVNKKHLKTKSLTFTSNKHDLKESKVFIITVPTPINSKKEPDLKPLKEASKLVASCMTEGSLVIYESTVYPGLTEEVCVPILEKYSNLSFNKTFFCGYSPERINPGDNSRKLSSITKIVSGSNREITSQVDQLYSKIIKAGTFKASSIKVAEAAKVIENTQRDLNIALMNELSILFNHLDIDTHEVLSAAKTKWNFMPFKPGLVGGHCIGVDPYYLTHKAKSVGLKADVIMAGRKTNDEMPIYVSKEVEKELLSNSKRLTLKGTKILILGMTFKEDCKDIRNTKVVDIYKELSKKGALVKVFDPWVDVLEVERLYKVKCLKSFPIKKKFDGIIIAVAHRQFKKLKIHKLRSLLHENGIIYDVKSIYPRSETDGSL